MSNLKSKDRRLFEELFDMRTGWVLDFSNSSMASFIEDEIHIDIYSSPGYEEYSSKANKLRQVWLDESDYKVGTLMIAMLDYYEDLLLKNNKQDDYKTKKIAYLRKVCEELRSNQVISVELPMQEDDSLSVLLEDIDSSLKQNKPELVLDRLHTYSTKYLRSICNTNGIRICDESGRNYSLTNLAGSIKKMYEKDARIQSSFSLIAIKSSISLFEKFNEVRNSYSYAHDNNSLNKAEAKYVVTVMAATLRIISEIEEMRSAN